MKIIKHFKNAIEGIIYALKLKGWVFLLQIVIAFIAVAFAVYFPLTFVERAIVVLCIALVLALEMINTAVEKMLDFFHPEFHKKIGFIKDLAAGAVLIVSAGAAAAGLFIFTPYIFDSANYDNFWLNLLIMAKAPFFGFMKMFQEIDLAWLNFAVDMRTNGLNYTIKILTNLGDADFVLFPILVLLIYFLWRKKWNWFYAFVLSVGGSGAIAYFLKKFISRLRPPSTDWLVEVSTYSFPSGHTMLAVGFYGMLAYFCWRILKDKKWKITSLVFFLAIILIVGFSRIYLGIHWPSDVFGGLILGGIWLLFTIWLIKKNV